jgi:rRNA maturation endonuclease Nob1
MSLLLVCQGCEETFEHEDAYGAQCPACGRRHYPQMGVC